MNVLCYVALACNALRGKNDINGRLKELSDRWLAAINNQLKSVALLRSLVARRQR